MTDALEGTAHSAGTGAERLPDLLVAAVARGAERTALVHRDRRTSWGELDDRSAALACALRARGLQRGDRVALQLGNTPDFVTAYLAVLRADGVAVPVGTGSTAGELEHVLADSGARVLMTTRSGAATGGALREGLPTLEHVVVAGSEAPAHGAVALEGLVDEGAGGPPPAPVSGGEDPAVVLYTSGTTGRPKGAVLSHRALLANLDQASRIDPPVVQADDVVLLVLPLFHVYGLNGALGMVLQHAATGVLVERFDPVDTLQVVEREHVTCVVAAPPVYVAWSMLPALGEGLSSVRLLLSGAAPLPPEVLHRVLDATGHHVFEGYGLTETAPVLTTTLMSEVAKPGSIGRPVPGVEIRLVDESGNPVEPGDPGEVVARGPNLFSGYWPDGREGPGPDGWWATGDVAYLDDDGDLHLVDRRKELVLVSGFNVYPREVEDVLLTHPDVVEAAVVGTPHPYTGEAVKAVLVLRDGAHLDADEVIAYCARSLARFKCPTAVEFVAELPHSATGKVRKGELREVLT